MNESGAKYGAIPEEMKCMRNWVIWGKNETNPKIPYSPLSLVEAKVNDPATWGTFDAAVAAAARLGRGGIGFQFGSPGGIAGIDLDHVIEANGKLKPFAQEIVQMMDSYTEYSPSGEGVHVIFKITESLKSFCARNRDTERGLEVYDTGRYFTVTGRVYGEPLPLNERTEALKKVCAKYLAETDRKERNSKQRSTESQSNSELWEQMISNPINGREIEALYNGDISGYGSQSEADLALCNHLAYWTNNNAPRMDDMFRESGLMRDKWDELHGAQTYGQRTILRAIHGTSDYKHRTYDRASTEGENGYADNNSHEEAANNEGKEEPVRPVSEYLNDFLQELLKSREGKAISTGFAGLDEILDGGLYPGLYFIGAISSLGKTTLALQIADNIAKSGQGVMIFSLEMSRNELMAKTLSRESLIRDLANTGKSANALTTRGILRASFSNEIQERLVLEAINDYSEWGQNIAIFECIGNLGVEKIKSHVKGFMSVNHVSPVVVIDYLQILAPYDYRYTDKQNIDKNVLELKRLSRDYQVPIIGISSFNRENYKEAVSMAAFKESGAIEYSSDVLIGMQIAGIERRAKESEGDYKARIQEELDKVSLAKRRGEPIAIEAKILKHRNGAPGRVHFDFYSKFNYFRERD